MNESNEQKKLRDFVLGDIPEAEIPAVEERLLTDRDFFQALLMTEEDLLQDYVDGNLSPADGEKFRKRFLTSDANLQRLEFARSLRRYIDESGHSRRARAGFWESLKSFFLSPVPIACAALLAVGLVGLFIWKNFPATPEVLIALNNAYQNERPLQSRITDLEYAPATSLRGGGPEQVDRNEFEAAKLTALKDARENPTAENLHALGRVYLAEKNFAGAVEQFERAVRLAPDNAKIHNDLGVALMEAEKSKAEGERDLENLARALNEINRAIELDPRLAAARFNRALYMQLMRLPAQEKQAWEEFLQFDSTSGWAGEARENLRRLETQAPVSRTKEEILDEYLKAWKGDETERAWQALSRNREMITGKLIPQQLAFLISRTATNGEAKAAREFLGALTFAGRLEAEKTNDSFWQDIAAFYTALPPEKFPILARAHNSIAKGYELCLQGRYKEAQVEFNQAKELFGKIGDTWEENLTSYWIGYCSYVLRQLAESKNELGVLAEYCEKNNYQWLLAHALFWLGVNYGSENQNTRAIDYYKRAFQAAEAASDFYNSEKILTETAEEYRLVGRGRESLKFLQKSLALSYAYPEASLRQRSRTYNVLVRTFYSLKSYEAALAFEKENVELLREIKDFAFHHVSTVQLGQIFAAQKNYAEALQTLFDSRTIAESLVDEEARQEAVAFSALQLANLQRQMGAVEEALAGYTQAAQYYDASQFQADRYAAHKGKLFCYLALRDEQNFASELATVLELSEKYRAEILDEENRNAFFDNEQDVYSIAIDYEYGRGNFQKALDYAERSRSRSLLDLLESGAHVENFGSRPEVILKTVAEPLSVEEIRGRMPGEVQIVQYSVLSDKVLIWLISKTSFEVVASLIPLDELKEKTDAYLKLVTRPGDVESARREQLAAELYRILISPVIDKIGPDKEICLIPDSFLFQLPFSSLISPASGEFFIAQRSLFFAPSANVFLIVSKNAERLGENSTEAILSIGNPAFSRQEFPDLPDLSAAEREAVEIARYYPQSTLLLGKDAAKEKVTENLPRAEVVHFAGHYVVDERSPLSSSFILAPNPPAKNPHLANYELVNISLPRVKLVVLSACQTGVESFFGGEGMIGAARLFLAAGIPLVVASNWQVDSEATTELMIRFHKYRRTQKLSTARALRQAQIDLFGSRESRFRHPFYWSGFITLGGYAQF